MSKKTEFPALVDQVAVLKILGISRSTLSRRRSKGLFPSTVPGLPLRWKENEILNYLNSN